MWAQLITMQLKPGEDTREMVDEIKAAEQPGSGLVRSIFMRVHFPSAAAPRARSGT